MFNKKGELVHKINQRKFKFTNQDEYEKIGKYAIVYVKNAILVEKKYFCLWLPSSIRKTKNSFENLKLHLSSVPQAEIYISGISLFKIKMTF